MKEAVCKGADGASGSEQGIMWDQQLLLSPSRLKESEDIGDVGKQRGQGY